MMLVEAQQVGERMMVRISEVLEKLLEGKRVVV